jgi:hypothetical protein
MEVRRRMRQRCFPGAVRKFLGFVAATGIQDRQTKVCGVSVWLHR